MSVTKQWDISQALAIAGLFHFFHGIGKFCLNPFLTIFFRYLGMSPPFVGMIMGLKHVIHVLGAPLCSYMAKTNYKRRVLITTSLLLSAITAVAFTFCAPLESHMVLRYCNLSIPWKEKLITPGSMDMELFGPEDNASFLIPEGSPTPGLALTLFTEDASSEPVETLTINFTTMENRTNLDITLALSSPTQLTETSTPHQKRRKTLIKQSAKLRENSTSSMFENISSVTSFQPKLSNHSAHKKKVRETSLGIHILEHLLDRENKIFLVVLGMIMVWSVFTAPLKWTADDSLYEYLDFVDATDRHGKVWIWSHSGACIGSFAIVFLIESLSCFLTTDIPRIYLHFYGYSAFMIITGILSTFYPIHVSKKTEHTNKTIKALSLIGSDGRVILLSITVFLTGAIWSTAHNFLFWQMQDVGCSELYMGISVAIALFSEIVLHFFKNKLFRVFSVKWIVVIGLGCLAVQMVYYSFLWTPWAVWLIQVLSAFSNGALIWAVNAQANDVATPGTERSLQLVLHCLSHDFGASLGSIVSGFIISAFGLPILFQACSVTLLLWISLFLLIHPRLPHTKKINYSRLLAADNSDMSDTDDDQERDWLVKAMKDDSKQW
ncbi:major facilitator superfamily domain-containing protein 6-like [Hyla sarda]|uniref:major facilitator superfamily domain-containing protein 6-like n=1 Tax=Hyla sarda TaxID=327740 RepID=UPI0024C246F9|nr:major facilitator superfamily domain-containing protein 6-like [Hyla sarda]XP_056405654.1 major facilitator superfamily domain-containing protein 6-like [Hyla sarda]